MTIEEYWNLIGREPFLAIIWEPDFSQEIFPSFCRMLMNHKNFHFTQIPDKTNDVLFLRSRKTMFLCHLWPFLVIFAQWGFFSKNPTLSLTTTYDPLRSQSEKKLRTEGSTGGRTDRQTLFYRTFPAETGVTIKILVIWKSHWQRKGGGSRAWAPLSLLMKHLHMYFFIVILL